MGKNNYTLGYCNICKKWDALCNNVCKPCNKARKGFVDGMDMPDLFKDIFGDFNEDKMGDKK